MVRCKPANKSSSWKHVLISCWGYLLVWLGCPMIFAYRALCLFRCQHRDVTRQVHGCSSHASADVLPEFSLGPAAWLENLGSQSCRAQRMLLGHSHAPALSARQHQERTIQVQLTLRQPQSCPFVKKTLGIGLTQSFLENALCNLYGKWPLSRFFSIGFLTRIS